MLAAGTAWLGMRSNPSDWAAPDSGGQQPARSALQVAELDAADAPKSVRLADGSVVKLRAGTSIAVDYEAASRRLTLKRGGARFFVGTKLGRSWSRPAAAPSPHMAPCSTLGLQATAG